jgi:hypothetical protein
MPSTEAPAVSLNEAELKRLRELRRTFLRNQGVHPYGQDNDEA